MPVITLRVLCSNCGGDERLSRLAEGTGACPWCQFSFVDDSLPAGGSGPVLLFVVLMEEECTGPGIERAAVVA